MAPGKWGQGGGCSTAPHVLLQGSYVQPGQLSTFTEGTVEEKQAGCRRRLSPRPAELVLPAEACVARLTEPHGRPCQITQQQQPLLDFISHHVPVTLQLLLNYQACSLAIQGYVPTPWVAARCVSP